jgi:hypothetical protein
MTPDTPTHRMITARKARTISIQRDCGNLPLSMALTRVKRSQNLLTRFRM